MKKNILILANLYPTEKKPFFGTFVRNVYESIDKDMFNKEKIVLPNFGEGIIGYIKFYFSAIKRLTNYKGLVYIHYVSHSVLPALICQLFNKNITIILNYHGSDAFPEKHEVAIKKIIKRIVCKVANKRCKYIIVPSNYFRKKIVESFKVPEEKLFISPSGGYDSDIFNINNCNSNSRPYDLLFASRMIEEKGCNLAAKVALRIDNLDKNYTYSFVGSGPDFDYVRTLLQPLIEKKICFIKGSLPQIELAEEFKSSRFFLFPSCREGESLGLVLVEAIACGAVPIVVEQGAVKEIIGDDSSILCCRKENFYSKVAELIQLDDKKIKIISDRLRDRIISYNRITVAKELNNKLRNI